MGRHYDDPLEFLLDGAAESERDDGSCKDLTPSAELRETWELWENAADTELDNWLQANAGLVTEDPRRREDNVAYDIFQTLAGAGVGIWDGRWDVYFGGLSAGHSAPARTKRALNNLQAHLERSLSHIFQETEAAINNEAYDQCRKHGSDEVSEDQGSPSLFTWGALERKNLNGLGEGRRVRPLPPGRNPLPSAMLLEYSKVNQRWFFTLGDSIIHLHDEPRSFATKPEAIAAARRRGLRLDAHNRVQPINPSNMEGV